MNKNGLDPSRLVAWAAAAYEVEVLEGHAGPPWSRLSTVQTASNA
jgi:hypothetical protein